MDTTKRRQQFAKYKVNELYSLLDALELVKQCATAKFNESVDVAVTLGVDPRKSDQMIRGSVVLPNGTGRVVRVAVFAEGALAKDATSHGADVVGLHDLIDQVKAGHIDFDVAIATPDVMKFLGPIGQILGPRGLMPNPKVGTLTTDIVAAVKNAKSGQVQYRTDKSGIVHATVGRVSFENKDLIDNIYALLGAIIANKPSGAKGQFVRRVSISSTMGIGVKVITDSATLKGG
jgi:large subunit ribosomal protein L1